ncbi:MAG: hypothetical protein QF913_02685 [Nitrospinaceae bacterium]|nr:hypothetical protein [Nitrospinaceae bacterium]
MFKTKLENHHSIIRDSVDEKRNWFDKGDLSLYPANASTIQTCTDKIVL